MRARGLVTVEHAPDNGKTRVVRVTEAGAVVARGVNKLHRQMSGAVYGGPSHDLEAFLALFERLDSFFADVIADTKATKSD